MQTCVCVCLTFLFWVMVMVGFIVGATSGSGLSQTVVVVVQTARSLAVWQSGRCCITRGMATQIQAWAHHRHHHQAHVGVLRPRCHSGPEPQDCSLCMFLLTLTTYIWTVVHYQRYKSTGFIVARPGPSQPLASSQGPHKNWIPARAVTTPPHPLTCQTFLCSPATVKLATSLSL